MRFVRSLLALFLVLTPVAAHAAQIRKAVEPVKDRFIVMLAPETADVDAAARELAAKYDGRLLAVWKRALKGFAIAMPAERAAKLAADPRVASMEEDAVLYPSGAGEKRTGAGRPADGVPPVITNDPDPLWHLTRISHRGLAPAPGETSIDFYSYRYTNDGSYLENGAWKPVKVYLIDFGVWTPHREFTGRTIAQGVNIGRNPDRGPYAQPAPIDPHAGGNNPCNGGSAVSTTDAFHGTAVASIVVGNNVGVAKGVELVPVQVASCADNKFFATSAMLIGGFEWVATNGQFPAVVSVSTYRFAGRQNFTCGIGDKSCVFGAELTALETAVSSVVDAGFPVVVSANNQNQDACLTTPARLSRRRGRVDASGERIGVITVGGSSRSDSRWDSGTGTELGSNFGQCVDIFAPAALMTPAFPSSATAYIPAAQNSGTSFSAPIVSGIIARMMAADPQLRIRDAGIQKRVWNALAANASPFSPSNVGTASPRLLAYLGAVTFQSQPPPTILAPVNTSVTLSVSVAEPVTYQWYEGTTLLNGETAASLTVDVTSAHAAGKSYWVRAMSQEHGTAYYADSNPTTVLVGTCAIPKITREPATVWKVVTAEAQPPTTFDAVVEAGAGVTYQWRWIRPDVPANSAGCVGDPVDCVVTSGSATGNQTLTLAVDTTSAPVTTYQLVITPSGSCGDLKVRSDTAQLRTCAVPATPTITSIGDGVMSFNERITGNVAANTKPVWLYSSTSATGPFVLLRSEIPNSDIVNESGNRWIQYDNETIVPPKPGWYALRAENGCGVSALSSAVQVTSTCTFELKGKYPGNGRQFTNDPSHSTLTVPAGTRVLLEARASFGNNVPASAAVTYSWSGNGDASPDGRWFRTAPLAEGLVTVSVSATMEESSCSPQTITFNLSGSTPGCATTFRAWVGHCSRENDAVIPEPQNTIMSLQAFVTDASGQVLPPDVLERARYEWYLSGLKSNDTARLKPATNPSFADYVVGSYDERITVEVTLDNCTDTAALYIQALPEFCDANCTSACNHMRHRSYVRVNGLIATTYAIVAGQTVTLSPPEVVAGATYQWYARALDSMDTQVFSTLSSVTIGPAASGEYWVVTTFSDGERVESEHLQLIVNLPESSVVTITPESRIVPADTNTSFTATYPGANTATRYEWRHGPDKKLYRPVIGEEATLNVHADNDTSFWCRVIQPATSETPEAVHDSGFAYLTVTCTNSVGGHVSADVPRLQRNQRSRINAFGRGKDLVYTWTRTYPNDPTPVVVEEWLPYIDPFPTQPVTHFSVSAIDSCGQTGDLGMVTIYLCVPTITQQPAGSLVMPGTPVTLTVAATPAIDGQTLTVAWYRTSDTARQTPLGNGWSFTPSVAPGTTESFYAAITSDCGGSPNVVTSQSATVSVCASPVITSVPQSYWIRPGQQAYIPLNANGLDLTYQWYVGTSGNTSTPITNATSSSITVTPSRTTSYWCRVTSQGLCSTDGATNTIKVCTDPTITTQPIGIRVFPNKTAQLSVVADAGSNTEPLTYRWQYQNASAQWVDISGATLSSYTTPPYTADVTYRVIVAAGACETTSQTVEVSKCVYNEIVPGSEHKIGYNESVSLQLPSMSPVEYKTITWYRGDVGDRSNPMRTAVATNLLNPTGSLTQTTLYWAEFVHEGCTSRTSVYTVRVCDPEITTQPSGSTIRNGQPATLTAGVTPITGQTFQWYRGAAGVVTDPVSGATSASVAVTPAVTTTYWLRVTGTCGLVADSNAVTVIVCNPPSISSVSPTRYIRSGAQTTVSVNATGSNLTYQWYVGLPGNTTVPLSNGLTTGTSQSATVAPNATTTYWCRVTSEGLCTVDSAAVTVDVCTDPNITTEPQSQVAFSGKPVTLSVAATGSGTLTYQWYQGASGVTSAPVSGQTSPTFTFNASTNTSYWCRVTTRVCSDDSAAATVSLCTYPEVVTASPETRNTFAGESVTMQLPSMSPVESKTITWYRGESGVRTTPLRSGVGSNLSLTVAPETTTKYWAEFVHNTCVSRTTTYTVNVCKPTITQQPQSAMTIQNGTSAQLTVGASGDGVTYQWYIGTPGDVSQPAPGASATTNSYTSPPLSSNTSYWVRVSGCGVTADSTVAMVTVCNTPTVTLSRTYNFNPGTTGTITATATGTALSYQWYRGQSGDTSYPISGAVNPEYSFTLVKSEYFWVRVTTACNNTSVNSAAILYDVAPKITVQPESVTIPYGGRTTLSVTATGNYVTYQWYQGSTAIPGATASTYTTPVLNANTNYRVKVSSGAGYANSNTAYITMCSGPSITSFTISYQYGTTYELYAKVSSNDVLDVEYDWYSGVPSDPSQSTFLGPGNPKMSFYNVTTPRTIWVRVKFEDGSCYKDTAGYTIP